MEFNIENIEEYIQNIAGAPEELVQEAYKWWDSKEEGIDQGYKHFVIMAAYLEEIYAQLLKLNEEK